MEPTVTYTKTKTKTKTSERPGGEFAPELQRVIDEEISLARERIKKTQSEVRAARVELRKISKMYPDSPAVREASARVEKNISNAEDFVERERVRLDDLQMRPELWRKWIPHSDADGLSGFWSFLLIYLFCFFFWILGIEYERSLFTWPIFVWPPALVAALFSLRRAFLLKTPEHQREFQKIAQQIQEDLIESVDILYQAAQRAKEGAKGVVICIENFEYCRRQHPSFRVVCALGYATCVLSQIPAAFLSR